MLLKRVQKQIEELNMIQPKDHIIVGVSGGADSVCLLLMLCELKKSMDFSIEAVHVEHGIRGEESRQDAAFVEMLCTQLGIVHRVMMIDVPEFAGEKGLGLEEAARILRYDIFEQVAKEKNATIALAHHMEDNAETILFQLARGSSLTGLCGIQPVRKSETGVTYIRPLLCLHRQEIESFLKGKEQEYCTDSTNIENEYSRNYLRNVILPAFQKINTQTVAHINETAGHLCEIREFVDAQVQECWDKAATVAEDIQLDVSFIKGLHVVLQKEIFYKAIGIMAGGKKDISSVHVEQLRMLAENQSGKTVTLPNGVIAIKENETIRLFLSGEKSDIVKEDLPFVEITKELLEEMLLKKESMVIPFGDGTAHAVISILEKEFLEDEIPQKTYTKWLDYDKINKGFCIRTRRSGDYLIYDVSGHRKKLKQYFVDEKVPVTKRDKTWILAQEDLVLWVVGGRISEHVKVTDKTKAIVEITIKEEA